MSRVRVLALCSAAGIMLAGCSTAPDQTVPTPSTSPDPTSAVQELRVGTAQGENGASEPWWNGNHLQSEIPAGVEESDKYRSEVFWRHPSGAQIRLQEGDRLSCEFTVTPHLGGVASDSDQWQVLWQLHGPAKDGQWPQPPLNLHIRGNTWRIGGGAGRPDGEESYAEPFPEFEDGHQARWRIDAVVSQDPAKARVDAWLNGEQVVTDWHPPSGTRYPDHDYLTLKSGLYAGSTGGADVPTTRRYTVQDLLRCSLTTPDGSPETGTPSPSSSEAR